MKTTKFNREMIQKLKKHFKVTELLGLVILIIGIWVVYPIIYSKQMTPEGKLEKILSDDKNCSMPCWREIKPGISTLSDFENSRNLLSILHYLFLIHYDNSVSWLDLYTGLPMELGFENDIVNKIKFRQPRSSTDIVLKMVTDLLGAPDAYSAALPADVHLYVDVHLYYEDGVVIQIFLPELPLGHPDPYQDCLVTMEQNMGIHSIILTSPDTAHAMKERLGITAVGDPVDIHEWNDSWEFKLAPCFEG